MGVCVAGKLTYIRDAVSLACLWGLTQKGSWVFVDVSAQFLLCPAAQSPTVAETLHPAFSGVQQYTGRGSPVLTTHLRSHPSAHVPSSTRPLRNVQSLKSGAPHVSSPGPSKARAASGCVPYVALPHLTL